MSLESAKAIWDYLKTEYEGDKRICGIMSLESAKAIWDYLKTEYEGDERICGMKVLNLIRDFELQRKNESQSVKEYSNKLLSIANKVRLHGFVL